MIWHLPAQVPEQSYIVELSFVIVLVVALKLKALDSGGVHVPVRFHVSILMSIPAPALVLQLWGGGWSWEAPAQEAQGTRGNRGQTDPESRRHCRGSGDNGPRVHFGTLIRTPIGGDSEGIRRGLGGDS